MWFSSDIAVYLGNASSHASYPKGAELQRSPVFGFHSNYMYDYTPRRRTTEFGVVTHMGMGLFLAGQSCRSPQWGLTAENSNFGGSSTRFDLEWPNSAW